MPLQILYLLRGRISKSILFGAVVVTAGMLMNVLPPLLFGGAIHDVFEQFDKGVALGEDREVLLRRCIRPRV
jgi:hypothetical protein